MAGQDSGLVILLLVSLRNCQNQCLLHSPLLEPATCLESTNHPLESITRENLGTFGDSVSAGGQLSGSASALGPSAGVHSLRKSLACHSGVEECTQKGC